MYTNSQSRLLICAFVMMSGVAVIQVSRVRGERPTTTREPWLLMAASVVNLPREENSNVADYYEVYAKSLRTMPVILLIGVGAKPPVDSIPLVSNQRGWMDEVDVQFERDGKVVNGYSLQALPNAEMAISADEGLRGDWTTSRRTPNQLLRGEGLQAYFTVSGPEGTELEPGTYEIRVTWKNSAEEFFGVRTSPSQDAVFRVKNKGDEDDRYTEDLIERHYLWACWLYKFDRAASKKEYEKAWALVQDYLKSGAGDEPGLWNITPRYQATAIAGKVDYHKEAIAYLSQLLSKDATERANGRDCKMRFYHFYRERGHLPHNLRDDLTRGLHRMYEQFYGKTMQGVPVERLPIRKKFPDESRAPEEK